MKNSDHSTPQRGGFFLRWHSHTSSWVRQSEDIGSLRNIHHAIRRRRWQHWHTTAKEKELLYLVPPLRRDKSLQQNKWRVNPLEFSVEGKRAQPMWKPNDWYEKFVRECDNAEPLENKKLQETFEHCSKLRSLKKQLTLMFEDFPGISLSLPDSWFSVRTPNAQQSIAAIWISDSLA